MIDFDVIYKKFEEESSADTLDFMYEMLGNLCSQHKIQDVDNFLSDVDLSRLSVSGMLCCLTITLREKEKFTQRNRFVEKIVFFLASKEDYSFERIQELLSGLT